MANFAPRIREAYLEILEREPDPGGLASFDALMKRGMSEDRMREALLRSPEFAARNPDPGLRERLGLNVHIPSDRALDDVARNLGMRSIRVDFDWFRIEPRPGEFRWEELDRVVGRAESDGLEVLAVLAYTPSWAAGGPGGARVSDPPTAAGSWTGFVEQAALRYAGRVRDFQLWNEPNVREFWSGSKVQYRREILEAGARVARAACPGCRIVGPGLANLRDWRDWFREAMAARELIDVVNHHSYAPTGSEALADLERDRGGEPSLRALIRELGVEDRPFWLTETGLRSSDGDQRRYYEEVVTALGQRTWVDRVFFFHYWDGPGAGDGSFGIVNEDFSPKPAYRFLQSVLVQGAGASLGGRVPGSSAAASGGASGDA